MKTIELTDDEMFKEVLDLEDMEKSANSVVEILKNYQNKKSLEVQKTTRP